MPQENSMNRLLELQEALKNHTAVTPRKVQKRPVTSRRSTVHQDKTRRSEAFNHYSLAQQAAAKFDDAKELPINFNRTVEINFAGRLEKIQKDPWELDQTDEGNCGFVAALASLMHLKGKKGKDAMKIKGEILRELLDAIYDKDEYKDMKLKYKNKNKNRKDKGIVQNRIEKRLQHYKGTNGEVFPAHPTDYSLLVGLMIFYKDYLRQKKTKLYQEQADFERKVGGKPGTDIKDKLHDLKADITVQSGYKKGDMALTEEGMRHLCEKLGMALKPTFTSSIIIQAALKDSKEPKKFAANKAPGLITQCDKDISLGVLVSKGDKSTIQLSEPSKNPGKFQWKRLTWPCIVGVYLPGDFLEKDYVDDKWLLPTDQIEKDKAIKKLANYMPYNLLTHWIFMPNEKTIWTWGKEIDLSAIDVWDKEYHFIPVHIIPVSV